MSSAAHVLPLEYPPSCDVRPDALMLLERVGGARLVRDMIALYTSYAPTRMGEAREALAAGDAEGVRRACHALKSGGAQIGLLAVAARCEHAERLATANDLRTLASVLDALERDYQRACVWLGRRPAHAAP